MSDDEKKAPHGVIVAINGTVVAGCVHEHGERCAVTGMDGADIEAATRRPEVVYEAHDGPARVGNTNWRNGYDEAFPNNPRAGLN